jgi:aminoglycoside phosphotransferase (APT) family kinase protein
MPSLGPTDINDELDVAAVSSWIVGLGWGAEEPLRFRRIGAGFSNLTFSVTDAGGRSWVLRRPPLGELLGSAHDVGREHRILTALERTDVPTPRVRGFCEDPAVTPVPMLLMDHVDGLTISSLSIAESLPAGIRATVGRALPEELGKVHAVDLKAIGLTSLSSSKTPYAARQIKRWRGQWEDSRTREQPGVEALAQRLWDSMPPQLETTLVHGDFHLLNLIVSPVDGEVRAIIDWELCTLGDPLADLGGLLAYWPTDGDSFGGHVPFASLSGFPSSDELSAIYTEATGRSLATLGFWHALGIWKVAIIAEGVLRRSLNDARNIGSARTPSAAQVDALVDRATVVADAAGI